MITHKHLNEAELKEAVLDWLAKHQIFDRKAADITFSKYEPLQNYGYQMPVATYGATVNFGEDK